MDINLTSQIYVYYSMKKCEKGVSPVIGIILMVAVSIALVALAASIVFNLGSNTEEPLQASIMTSLDEGEIDVKVIRNENINRVFVRDIEGNIIESRDLDDGETVSFSAVPTGGGTYQVVGEQEGREQVIRLYEIAAVRIDMTLGGEITYDAEFNITHKVGDNIDSKNIQVWVDATDACSKTSKIINLPADKNSLADSNVPSGNIASSIISGGYPSDEPWSFGVINTDSSGYNMGLYESGEKIGFSVAETDCTMNVGDKITVSVVDITGSTPVIVGQGEYTVT